MSRLIWLHRIGSGGCHPGRNMKSNNIQRVRQRSEPHGLGRRRHQAAYHPNLKYDVRTSVLQAVLEVDCSSCSTVELCLLPFTSDRCCSVPQSLCASLHTVPSCPTVDCVPQVRALRAGWAYACLPIPEDRDSGYTRWLGKVVKPRRGLYIRHRERYIGLVKKAEANDMVDSLSHEAFTGCLIFGHDEHPRTSRVWLC